MSRRDPAARREIVRAHRERQRAAGRINVNTDLPGDLVAIIDRMKEERGLPSRAPLIEEALRLLIEKQRA
jgi:metal-responsive CopG/Arc/MetJ family transcriptional regulator